MMYALSYVTAWQSHVTHCTPSIGRSGPCGIPRCSSDCHTAASCCTSGHTGEQNPGKTRGRRGGGERGRGGGGGGGGEEVGPHRAKS